MKSVDSQKIRDEYVMGEISLEALAAQHGLATITLKKRSAKEKWADLRAQYRTDTSRHTWQIGSVKESETRVRHIQLSKEVLTVALAGLALTDPADLSPRDIVALIKLAWEIECRALGLPEEHSLSGSELDAVLREQLERLAGLRQAAAPATGEG